MEYSSTMSGSLVNDMLLKAKTTEEAKEALAREYEKVIWKYQRRFLCVMKTFDKETANE